MFKDDFDQNEIFKKLLGPSVKAAVGDVDDGTKIAQKRPKIDTTHFTQ